ncbi:hypothetical protein GCM10027610_100530 [Dactylosporangium cerinum]
MPADERLGAAEAGLLGVGEQEHDVVAGFRTGGQGTGDLEQGAGAGAVVVGAVADLDGVVVRHQDDLAGGGGTGQDGDDVADVGHAAVAELARVDPDGVLDLGPQPVAGEGGRDVLADPVGGGAAGDVDLLADPLDVGERAGGGEVTGGRRGGARRRRLHVVDAEEREHGEGRECRKGREGRRGGAAKLRSDKVCLLWGAHILHGTTDRNVQPHQERNQEKSKGLSPGRSAVGHERVPDGCWGFHNPRTA